MHEGPPRRLYLPQRPGFPCLAGAFLQTPGEKSPGNPISVVQGKPRRRRGSRPCQILQPAQRAAHSRAGPVPPRGARPVAGPRAGPASAGRAGTGRIGLRLRAGYQARSGAGPGRLDAAGGAEGGCLRSRAAGQPAPPAGIRAGCLRTRQRRGRGRARGHRPGPPRSRPCRPAPLGAPAAPPPGAPAGPCLFPPVRGPAAPGGRLPLARREPDLTGRAERSAGRRGPADGPPPGTPTAPGRPPATPDDGSGIPGDPLLTIEEVTAELRVSRAAFYRWRRQRAGPPAVRLPGGGVRVRRSALAAWLRQLEDTQDGQEQRQ